MTRSSIYLLFSFLIVGAMSCTSSTSTTPGTTITKVVDTSGLPTGTIAGHVRLIDSIYRPVLTGGAIASLEGTSIQALTDSSGLYTISNIPAGTYNLVVSKPGFGMCKFFNITAIGPATTVISPMILARSPVETIHLDSIAGGDTVTSGFFSVLGSSSNYFDQYLVVFVDLDSNRQIDDPHLFEFEGNRQSGLTVQAQVQIPTGSAALKSGTRLYLTAVMYNRYSDPSPSANSQATGTYYDPLRDQNRYISTGPCSNVLTLTVQ